MLVRLSIRDIVLIDALDLDFGQGLTTLTGETGAGKSILLDAFVLALGGRGDASLVRAGCEQGQVTAVFDLALDHPAHLAAREFGLASEDEMVLRRVQASDGRTRAFVNDQPATAQALRAIGRELVEIHCQHDDRALVDPSAHRALVDAHGGLQAQANEVRAKYGAWQAARRALQGEEARIAKARADADYLRHAHEELTKLAPEAGEEEALAERRLFMQRAEKVATDIRDALAVFADDRAPAVEIGHAARRFERRVTQSPQIMEPPAKALAQAVDALSLAEQALEQALAETRFDPAELERVEERLFALRGAARKYQVSVQELPKLAEKFADDIAALDASEAHLAKLGKELDAARAGYGAAARALSEARKKAARKLDALVDAELKPLKLEGAHFSTQLTSDPESGGAEGIDRVEFWVQTNPGSRPGPLTKVASGGELARFMLALKVVLADRGSAPTLVFDEIDTGVGGAVADAIGQRLARLAKRAQVLAVTHAPQVAACALRHLRISKSASSKGKDKRVATSVAVLAEEERREEIARMLSGAAITDEARAAAMRLLEGAG
ncbi:DNA repair protein RecN [Methylocystis parvus]|uniref:DNA repair protein RecN n=1 Tax=Methylocystis parvus TaxID=134 RepID=A0A6B8MCD1_9HYPH|nr:DNA repair protein RecN [Methylocystis parvus]QGM98310.1 DNA repair protein RecN [Methylocystis parvus]WBK01362.1 DNA repair protein RecN [Methylocystis parvus OBBP]